MKWLQQECLKDATDICAFFNKNIKVALGRK